MKLFFLATSHKKGCWRIVFSARLRRVRDFHNNGCVLLLTFDSKCCLGRFQVSHVMHFEIASHA